MANISLTIIKPDAFEKGYAGKIIDDIIKGGFNLVAMKLYQMSEDEAKRFYSIHSEKPFFSELIYYITSGPIIVAIVKKENAVEDFRLLIGNTDPTKADEGTIRAKFGTSITNNAIHGSDSNENAELEASYFFSLFERY